MAHTPQQFCLRWNNHQSNIISVFEQLLQSEAFVDVTLAVEGMSLKAHKVVLSACSPYFQAVLASHPDKHPIVILKDVRYTDMRDLLDFMYRGEVSVDQDNLSGFLRVAESLRIKGLTEVNEKKRLETCMNSSFLQQSSSGGGGSSCNIATSSIISSCPPISSSSSSLVGSGEIPSLKRPPLSPTGSFNKRRRGRPPKISGDESEGEIGGQINTNHAGSVTDGEDSLRPDSEPIDIIKQEAEDGKEDHNEHSREAESRTTDSAGPSGELHVKDELKLPKEEPEHTRESPGSDLCCVPDIWMNNEDRVVKSNHCHLLSRLANSIATTVSSNLSTSSVSPISSTPSTPSLPMVKQERPTPTNTPNSTLTITPTSPTNSVHISLPPIFAPIQHVPLDLHVTDYCDGNLSDSDQPNITLDYVLNGNGTATCKLCGELLPSRNHWYRHKYKTHANALYRCDQCGVVYKSKKGFETHMEVKHAKVKVATERPRRRDWEGVSRVMEEAKRQQEEAMVKAIIARVKMECAMEGEDCSRRGYQKH